MMGTTPPITNPSPSVFFTSNLFCVTTRSAQTKQSIVTSEMLKRWDSIVSYQLNDAVGRWLHFVFDSQMLKKKKFGA
jgi:hypothetical protein